jgi:hypothetical protein
MPQSLAEDVFNFTDMMLVHKIVPKKITVSDIHIEDDSRDSSSFSKELSFSELEKQMNLNASQIPCNFQINNSEIPSQSKDHINIEIPNDLNIDFLSESRERSQFSSTNSGTYESSPESSFPYTPVDSLESCTTGSIIENETYTRSVDRNDEVIQENITYKEINLNTETNTISSQPFLSDLSLDQEIEQIIKNPLDSSFKNINFSNTIENSGSKNEILKPKKILKRVYANENNIDNIEAKKQKLSSVSINQENKFLRCFSILRTNYLSLCESYNDLVDKLSASEEENRKLRSQSINLDAEKEQWKIDKDRILLEREEMKAILDSLLHEVTILRSKENQHDINFNSRKTKALDDNSS